MKQSVLEQLTDNEDPLAGLTFDTENMKLFSINKEALAAYGNDEPLRMALPTPRAGGDSIRGLTSAFSNMSPAATHFLQNAVTFDMAVNSRIKRTPSSGEVKLANSTVGGSAKITRSIEHKSSIVRPASTSSLTALQTGNFSTYDNASQANELIWSLVHGHPNQQKVSPQNYILNNDSRTASNGHQHAQPPTNETMNPNIRTVGLMSKFMPEHFEQRREEWITGGGGTRGRPNLNLPDGPNGFLSPALLRSKHSFLNSYGRQPSNSNNVSHSNMSIPDDSPRAANATSNLFASVVDSVFLIGPSRDTIYDFVNQMNPPQQRGSFSQSEGEPILNGTSTLRRVVDPAILFMTHCDNPAEMLSLLPQYCFPSGVEINIISTVQNANSTKNKPGFARKNSSLVVAPTAPVTPNTAKSNRMLRPFFPSDFSLGATAAAALTATMSSGASVVDAPIGKKGGSVAEAPINIAAKKGGSMVDGPTSTGKPPLKSCFPAPNAPAPPVAMAAKSPFVLQFGDHTYQQYCLGLQIPVQFYDPRAEVVIHSSYVVCLMTKLPLFCYLFHLLELFETIHQGFKFMEPLNIHDENFPTPSDLRPLSDLAARLKRMTAPLYPFLFSNGAGSQAVNSLLMTDEQVIPGEFNTLLPDVEMLLTSRSMPNARIDLPFKRRAYQAFFSSAAAQFDPSDSAKTDKLIDLFNRQMSMNAAFTPTAVHKSERDREDVYMTLLWALPVLLRSLPLDQIILALGCAVTEMRIVVKHKDFHVISGVILALIALLKPLKWCAPVIVILPDSLSEFVESPVPIIIGLNNLPENFVLQERFVVIDPQERIVHLNPTDVVVAHTILLPHASKLVNVLRAPTDTIIRLTKKKKSAKPKKVVYIQPQQSTYNFNPDGPLTMQIPPTEENGLPPLGKVSPEDTLRAANPTPNIALPMELDVGSADSLQLLSAVKAFSNLVGSHIEAIVNTAIQIQHEDRNVAKAKRRQLNKTPTPAPAAHVPIPHKARPMSLPVDIRRDSNPQTLIAASHSMHNLKSDSHAQFEHDIPRPPHLVISPHESPMTTPKRQISGAFNLSPTNHNSLASPSSVRSGQILTPLGAKTTVPFDHHGMHQADGSRAETKQNNDSNNHKKIVTVNSRHSLPSDFKPTATTSRMMKGPDLTARPSPYAQKKGGPQMTPPKTTTATTTGVNSKSPPRDNHTPPRRRTGGHPLPRQSISPMIENSRVSKVLNAYEVTKQRNSSGGGGSGGTPKLPGSNKNLDSSPANSAGLAANLTSDMNEEAPRPLPVPPINLGALTEHNLSSANLNSTPNSARLHPSPRPESLPRTPPNAESPPVAAPPQLIVPTEVYVQPPSVPAVRNQSISEYSELTYDQADSSPTPSPDKTVAPKPAGPQKAYSSNSSGSEKSSSGASVSSNASSLPSLRLNAPLMSVKEIGQGGAKFIAQLLETQMFCNYCQNLKVQSASDAAARERAESAGSSGEVDAAVGVAASVSGGVFSPGSGELNNLISPKIRNRSRTHSVGEKGMHVRVEDPEAEHPLEDLDALSSVFELMLTGSLSMKHSVNDKLVNDYHTTYGAPAFGSATISAGATLLSDYAGIMDVVRNMPLNISAYAKDYCKKTPATTNVIESSSGLESISSAFDQGALIWCNGLLCRGMCNTPFCSDICLQLWEKRVQKLRQQTVLQNIVNRHHHSDLVMKSHFIRVSSSGEVVQNDRKSPNKGKKSTDRIVKVNLKPKVEATRHQKETESQFNMRQWIIKGSSDAAAVVKTSTPSKKEKKEKKVKPVVIKGPIVMPTAQSVDEDPTAKRKNKMVYARSTTADAATMKIAQYYADKQTKILTRRRKKAMRIVKRFLLTYVVYCRKIKFIDSIVRIQCFTRGYIIRYHIAAIVEALIARKIERLLACIRIRTFLRFHAKSIARKWSRRVADEMRRKRTVMSIPVGVSSPNTPRSKAKSPSPVIGPGARKSIRDGDIQEGSGGFVSSLYSSPRSPSPAPGGPAGLQSPVTPRKSITVPSLAQVSPDAPAGFDFLRNKPNSPRSAMSTLFEQVEDDVSDTSSAHGNYKYDTSLIDKLNANYTTMPPRHSDPHQPPTLSNDPITPSSGAEKHKKFGSTRTYSEKAKEFLQFGKILHRSISSSSSSRATPRRSTMYNFKPTAAPGKDNFANMSNDSLQGTAVRPPPIIISRQASGTSTVFSFDNISSPKLSFTGSDQAPLSTGSKSSPSTLPSNHSPTFSKKQSHHSLDEIEAIASKKSAANNPNSSYANSGTESAAEVTREMALSPTSGIPTFACDYESSSGEEEVGPYRSSSNLDANRRRSSGDLQLPKKSLAPGGGRINRYNSNYISGDTGKFASRYLELDVPPEEEDDEVKRRSVDKAAYGAEIAAALMSESARSFEDLSPRKSASFDERDSGTVLGVLTVAALKQREREATPTALPIQLQKELLNDAPSVRASVHSHTSRTSLPKAEESTPPPADPRPAFAANKGQMRSVGSIVQSVVSSASSAPSSGGETTITALPSVVIGSGTKKKKERRDSGTHSVQGSVVGSSSSTATVAPGVDHAKKMSPIGRYAAEHNYDISKIVSSNAHFERSASTQGHNLPHMPRPPLQPSPTGKIPHAPSTAAPTTPGAATTVVPKFDLDKRGDDSPESHQPFSNPALMASRSSSRASTPVMAHLEDKDQESSHEKAKAKEKPSLTIWTNGGDTNSDASMTPIDITGKFRSMGSSADSNVLGTRSGSKHLSMGSDSSRISHISSSSSEHEDEEEDEDAEEEDNVVQDDLAEAMKTIPLRTLGSSVHDCLNRQQLQTIKTMWSLLRAGVEILKHGRSGKPKFKTLLCDVDMTKLYWREPGSRPDPDQDESDIEVDSLYPGSIVPRSGSHGALHAASGAAPKKSKRSSGGGRRSSILKSNSERVIHFNEIIQVYDDCSSEVFKRSLVKQYVTGNTCTISVVLADERSLDFEIKEETWGPLYRALQILVTYYQGILPSRRSNSISMSQMPTDTALTAPATTTSSDNNGSADKKHPRALTDARGTIVGSSTVTIVPLDDDASSLLGAGITANNAGPSTASYIAFNTISFSSTHHAKKGKESKKDYAAFKGGEEG
eukprot:gene22726-28882_t